MLSLSWRPRPRQTWGAPPTGGLPVPLGEAPRGPAWGAAGRRPERSVAGVGPGACRVCLDRQHTVRGPCPQSPERIALTRKTRE